MTTPERAFPSLVMIFPRNTAARFASIVPGATPVWTGTAPVYRNSVAFARLVATVGSIGGATVPGSGGSPPPGPREITRLTKLPSRTELHPTGVWLITLPAGIVGLFAVVMLPNLKIGR